MAKQNNEYPRVRKSFFRTRTFWGIACIVVAAVIAFIGLPFVEEKLDTSTTAVIAAQDLPRGTLLTNSDLQVVSVPSGLVRAGYVADVTDLIGKYALTDLSNGDYITAAKVAAEMPYDAYLYRLPADRRAISVDIPSFAAGVSGKLLAGDIVSIAEVKQVVGEDGHLETVTSILPELTYVRILAVTNANGNDVDNSERSAEGSEDETAVNATVTFEVQTAQAVRLASLNHDKTIHMIFVCRGVDSRAEALLQEQEMLLLLPPVPEPVEEEGADTP